MKKVTIITPPEYEGPVLEALGRAQVTQLKHVTGSDFEDLESPSEQKVDYKTLYQKVQNRLLEPLDLDINKVQKVTPPKEDLKEFALDPEGKINSLIEDSENLLHEIAEKREEMHVQNNKLVSEMNEKVQSIKEEQEQKYEERLKLKTRLDSVTALEPDELKNCFAVGVVKTDFIPQLKEYLKRYPEAYTRISELSKDESLVFVFGDEESRDWIESLFLIYDIKDIFDVLDPSDVLLVLDESKRKEAIKKYKQKLAEAEKTGESQEEYEKTISKLKDEYNKKIKENERKYSEKIEELQKEQEGSFGILAYYARILWLYSRRSTPVLRSKVISILQGYTPEKKIDELRNVISEVESQIGERIFVEVSDLDEDDKHAPTPEKDFKSEKLQPLWILTRLRGWPSAEELNPGYISVLVFCFQFGLMFGDIGQGLVFLALGLALNGKYKSGLMKYLFALFIPMGIAAVVFGFMYDSIFLYEHLITHWLHEAHITLPFNYPIMPNPMHETGKLMNLIFMVGAVELVFGAMLGAYNSYKEGNYAGMIGEHGFGMGLYVTGLYLSAATMFTEGLDIMQVVSSWTFSLMLLGMGLSFVEPILHSVMHGHGVGGMETIGEGIGGLLMTFVEGLANMFSFLRVAAFAIAHVSLSGAGEAMGHAINSPLGGMILMNIIALTFEFVSSSVQSVRLLYYEFMGKFFHGEGRRFRPFRVPTPKPMQE